MSLIQQFDLYNKVPPIVDTNYWYTLSSKIRHTYAEHVIQNYISPSLSFVDILNICINMAATARTVTELVYDLSDGLVETDFAYFNNIPGNVLQRFIHEQTCYHITDNIYDIASNIIQDSLMAAKNTFTKGEQLLEAWKSLPMEEQKIYYAEALQSKPTPVSYIDTLQKAIELYSKNKQAQLEMMLQPYNDKSNLTKTTSYNYTIPSITPEKQKASGLILPKKKKSIKKSKETEDMMQFDNIACKFTSIMKLADSKEGRLDMVGGKAYNLGELIQAGQNVPPGFVITTHAYEQWLDTMGLNKKLGKFVEALQGTTDLKRINYISNRIQQIISVTSFHSPLTNYIRSMLAKCSLEYEYVAIRSSAVGEDGEDTSFAGQHATYLGVYGLDNIIQRIRACFSSLYSFRALSYRVRRGLPLDNIRMAVVVQKLVEVSRSGVMFTQNPNTNDRETIIEAVWGLGEALVSGNVTPDKYVVHVGKPVEGDAYSWQIGNRVYVTDIDFAMQEKRLALQYGDYRTTGWYDVPRHVTIAPKLEERHVEKLYSSGAAIEKWYDNVPQDIEWAIDDNERLYIVQARPLTAIRDNKVEAELDLPVLATGSPASFGIGIGPVRVIENEDQLENVKKGDVLVTSMTTPDYVPVFDKISGIATKLGGTTCHAAIVSREYNIPCVVGLGNIAMLTDGKIVTVDGSNGIVYNGQLEKPKLGAW